MIARSSRPANWRRSLRWTSLAIVCAAIGFWAGKGAHTGWSMHRVPINQVDEITGIAFVTYEDRFVPGIEWLGGGLGLAVLVFAVSFFFRSQPAKSIA